VRLTQLLASASLVALSERSPAAAVDPKDNAIALSIDALITMSDRTTLRGIVVLGPIGSEAEVNLRVSGSDIQLAGLTEGIARVPGREVEVVGRFLSDVRFFVEAFGVDPHEKPAT
jgi:hypothetical protein